MTQPASIRAVLFDMGGVLVQLDSLVNVLGPSSLDAEDVSAAWILSDAVRDFERGTSSVEEFASAIMTEMRLQGTADQFLDRFARFPQGLYPGAEALVRSVPKSVTTGILSNTSAYHWSAQRDGSTIRDLCDRSYLSFDLGMVKPDRDIFDHAVADLGLAAEQVLFIDDNPVNVDGARAAGLQAGLAKGPEQAGEVLREHGVTG